MNVPSLIQSRLLFLVTTLTMVLPAFGLRYDFKTTPVGSTSFASQLFQSGFDHPGQGPVNDVLLPATTKLDVWIVADTTRNGLPFLPTGVPAGSFVINAGPFLGPDDYVVGTDKTPGNAFGATSQPGRYGRNGVAINDLAADADIYFLFFESAGAAQELTGQLLPPDGGAGATTPVAVMASSVGVFAFGNPEEPPVGNAFLSISSATFADQFTVGGGGGPVGPTITQQPVGRNVLVGANVTFAVTATGTAPLSFQWTKDGVPLEGATASELVLNGVTLASQGLYRVVVSNVVDQITSDPAQLTVNEPVVPPSIITQPVSQTADEGGLVTFTVEATGTAPLRFEWRRNGTPIPGAIAASLVINPVTVNDAGDYTVVVSNSADSVTSSPATLTINPVAPLVVSIGTLAEGLRLAWTGGRPPYTVQRKAKLGDAGWESIGETAENQLVIPAEGDAGFLRVTSP